MSAEMVPPTPAEIEAICAARVGEEWATRSEEHRTVVRRYFIDGLRDDTGHQKDLRIYRAGVAAGGHNNVQGRLSLTREEARLILFGGSTIKKSGGGADLLARVDAFLAEEVRDA